MSYGLVDEQLEKRGSGVEVTMKSKGCNIEGYQSKRHRSGGHRVKLLVIFEGNLEIWLLGVTRYRHDHGRE